MDFFNQIGPTTMADISNEGVWKQTRMIRTHCQILYLILIKFHTSPFKKKPARPGPIWQDMVGRCTTHDFWWWLGFLDRSETSKLIMLIQFTYYCWQVQFPWSISFCVYLVSEEILSEERAQIMVENYKLGGLMRYLVRLAIEKDVSLIEFILLTWHFCFSALSIRHS